MSFYLESDLAEMAESLGDEAQRFAGRTVLLCGGGGFLGRHFCQFFGHLNRHVLARPVRLIVCDNFITSTPQEQEGVLYRRHDITQPLTVEEDVHFVIQAAGIASPFYYRKYPLETLEVATTGTKQTLEMARQHKLEGFLFFSSSEIYGDPDPQRVPTPESYRGNVACLGPRACYDESKRLGETLCSIYHQLYGVPTRMVRPFNVYGPGMQETDYRVLANFASRVVAGKPLIIYGSGQQTRTFCYITDAIVGFLKVLLNGSHGQPYNIGNPKPEVSMLELARALERVMGRSLDINLSDYPDSYPADEPQRRCPDITKAATQLGFLPRVGLDEGLRRFMDWAQAHYTGLPFQ